jgi:O-antigen/teichoic acid export membrane protein
MGVIKRQSLKFTVINLIGTLIGFVSVVLIYPLEKEAYGFFQFLFNSASLILPFLGLGVFAFTLRYAPQFALKEIKPYLMSFVLKYLVLSIIVMTILGGIILYIFNIDFTRYLSNYHAIKTNFIWIYFLAILILLISTLSAVSSTYFRIVIPDILNALLLKITLPIGVLLVALGYLKSDDFTWLSLIYFSIIGLTIFYYVNTLDSHKWGNVFDRFTKSEYVEMLKYVVFICLNGLGASLTLKLDVSMIGSMLSLAAVGTFSLVMTISNVIEIPTKALTSIASPIIADSWATNNIQNIRNIFIKSSLYGEIVGVFLFLIIYHLWPEFIAIMPGDKGGLNLHLAAQLFIFLGLGRLINLSTGVNSLVIAYSKDYKYQLYFLAMLGLSNVGLNYYFINTFGIVGAAMATFISLLVFNASQNAFLYYKYGFNLDGRNMMRVLLAGLAIFMMMKFVQPPWHPMINIIIKSLLISFLYLVIIWWINPGGELRLEALRSLQGLRSKLPEKAQKTLDKLIHLLPK